MKFAKRTYLAQVITYGIILFLLCSIILFTTGLFAFVKLGFFSDEKALEYALLLVLMLIASAIALGFVLLIAFQFFASLGLLKALKVSPQAFLAKTKSRKINTAFGLLTIIAGVVAIFVISEIILSIVLGILTTTILIFLTLDKISLKRFLLDSESN